MNEQKNTSSEAESTFVCEYKNANAYVMICEEKNRDTEADAAAEQPIVELPAEENIEVPIVGDTEAESVEPLGETASWYPDTVNYDNVVNYEYGTSSTYVASLTNPEVGFEVGDILLVVMIALSCLAIAGSIAFLTGRALSDRIK